jgi:hypothetical protein
MKGMVYSVALLAIASTFSWAKVAVVFRLASPPLAVEAGQRFSLCAANVGAVNVDLTLQFVNVRTGAIVASREVTLPQPGSTGRTLNPCLEITADAVSAPTVIPADPPMLVALVEASSAGRPRRRRRCR